MWNMIIFNVGYIKAIIQEECNFRMSERLPVEVKEGTFVAPVLVVALQAVVEVDHIQVGVDRIQVGVGHIQVGVGHIQAEADHIQADPYLDYILVT